MFEKIELDCAMASHPGKIRGNNEDMAYSNGTFFINIEKPEYCTKLKFAGKFMVFAVCDGMGGESHGELASMEAVRALEKTRKTIRRTSRNLSQVVERFKLYIEKTNQTIYEYWTNTNEGRMGSTFTGLVFYNNQAFALNLGDSRVYLQRQGTLIRLTKDHTEAERLASRGLISREEIDTHKKKHMLVRHFGVGPDEGIMEADFSEVITPRLGDLFLLCSDGLTDMIRDEQINLMLHEDKSAEEIALSLILEALNKGGRDNVTVIVLKVAKLSKGIRFII